jgi:acyl carrier protein
VRPDLSWGPDQIPEWDSLGTLRLLLAIEEAFGITVSEKEIQAARTVASLSDTVERARRRTSEVAR